MLGKFVYVLFLSVLSFNAVHSQDICNFTVTIDYDLQYRGFHRNISYDIEFENHSLHKKHPVYFYDNCIVAIQQLLPAGVYVDPDELETMRRNNLLSAYPHNGMNIEVAAPYARPFNAYIFSMVKFNTVTTYLPVHARYQSPTIADQRIVTFNYAKNIIIGPTVYLRCPDRRLDDCDMPLKTKTYLCDKDPLPEEKCIWKQIPSKPTNKTMTWKVPIGNLNHFYMVELVTMVAVVMGSLALIQVIHSHKMSFTVKNFQ